jgi:hypothetical protein
MREAGPFLVRTVHYSDGQSLAKHDHPHAYFCRVLRGGYSGTYGDSFISAIPQHAQAISRESLFGEPCQNSN